MPAAISVERTQSQTGSNSLVMTGSILYRKYGKSLSLTKIARHPRSLAMRLYIHVSRARHRAPDQRTAKSVVPRRPVQHEGPCAAPRRQPIHGVLSSITSKNTQFCHGPIPARQLDPRLPGCAARQVEPRRRVVLVARSSQHQATRLAICSAVSGQPFRLARKSPLALFGFQVPDLVSPAMGRGIEAPVACQQPAVGCQIPLKSTVAICVANRRVGIARRQWRQLPATEKQPRHFRLK